MSKVLPLTPTLERRVLDAAGEPVGRVTEFLFDLGGRIEYVCIALARPAAERHVEAIIPWSAVIPPIDEHADWRVLAQKVAVERVARAVRARDDPPAP